MTTGGNFHSCASNGCAKEIVERCGCDDTTGDGIGDVRYIEIWAIDPCNGEAPQLLGTWVDGDFDQPYTPTNPVDCPTTVVDESPAEPCDTTTPLASVGLCLADGTPIAVTIERTCDGAIDRTGWLDLTTGTWSAGDPPAGTIACGDSQAFHVSGVFCDIDPATGDVYGLVLVEIERGPDGDIVGTRLISPVDGSEYTLQGELSVCPTGTPQPEQDLAPLCDQQPDGTTVPFIRDYRRDENGVIVGHSDYTLDGTAYTPTGTVDMCTPDESPPEPCHHCHPVVLCDDGTPATIEGTTAGGTLPNGVTWSSRGTTAPQPATTDNTDGAWWPGVYSFPNPTIGDATWEFDRPVVAEFSIYMRWVDFTDPADLNATQLPPGVEVVDLPAGYHYDPATRRLSVDDTRGDPGGEDCANLTDPNQAASARLRTTTPVTSLTTRYLGARAAACGQFGTQRVGAFSLTPAGRFLRTICRGCDGQISSVEDTELDGITPYTPVGQVGPCHPPPQPPETPCVGGVQTLRMCDLDPDAAPDSQGRICATPFLRHLVYGCDGTLTQVRDTELDGATEYTPVQVVDCHTTIPGMAELQWPLTGIDDDPDGVAGRDYLYTLTNPTSGEQAQIHLSASSTAGAGCTWTGPPSPTNPPIFNNPTGYTYTLDEAARAMSRFRLDFLDLDTFEGVRNLTPVPDQVVFVQGAGVWNGSSIDATVANSVVQVFWNQPPETISHSYANTGGGLACHSAVLAAITLTPEGCCTCGDDESPGEPECRNTTQQLLCDVTETVPLTVFDPVNTPGADGWEVVNVQLEPGCATLNPPEGTVPFPPHNINGHMGIRSDLSLGQGCSGPWAGYDAAPNRWILRKTFTAPQDGTASVASTGFRGDGGARVRVNGTDAGMYGQWNQPATAGTAQIPVTAGPNTVEIEVRDTSGPNWVTGRLEIVMQDTVEFFRTRVVDCDGNLVSQTDTTLDGQPYEVAGEVRQCQPTAGGCVNCETLPLCDDLGDATVEFLRTICRDCAGGDVSRLDTTLDGEPYLPQGQVRQCFAGDESPPELCRHTTTLLLCGAEDHSLPEPSTPQTVDTDPVAPSTIFVNPACSTNRTPWPGDANILWSGGAITFDPGPDSPQCGRHHAVAAQLVASAASCDESGEALLAASVTVERTGPNTVCGGAGGLFLVNTATGQLVDSWLVPSNTPVGWSGTLSVQATVPVDDLAAGSIVAVVNLETGQANIGCGTLLGGWNLSGFAWEPTFAVASCPGGQFFRTIVTDCDGNTVEIVDTDLDGNPIDPVPDAGDCQTAGGGGIVPPPCGDVEPVTWCDIRPDGTVVPFLRHYRYNCAGQLTATTDTTIDGVEYEPEGEVGLCGADESPGESPCRNTSTLLVCDIPTDGVEGQLTATDTTVQEATPARAPLAGGGGALWAGGPLTFPADSDGSAGDGVQVYRGVAAELAATAAPTCDDGTVELTVSVRVTNDGPTAGAGYSGHLAILNGGTVAASDRLTAGNAPYPPGFVRTLTANAIVDPADLAAGNIVAELFLETFQGGGKQWTADQFTTAYAYGVDGCATQVFANVVTDCETGQVESVTYTTPDGAPYTPAGQIGQCQPAGGGQPCTDCETITLCDLGDTSPGASPGEVEPVPFLRHICRGCNGQVTSVEDTTLDGQPYEPVGEVGLCGPGGEQPCRNTSTLLVCDVEDQGQVSGNLAAAPVADPSPFNAWHGYGVPADTWCQENGNPGTVFSGGSTTLGPGTVCPASGGGGGAHEVIAATIDDPGLDCAEVIVTASVRVTNNGPAAGFQVDGRIALWNTHTQTRLAFTNPAPWAPVGHVETVAVSATVSGADLAAGAIAFSVDLEVEHQGAKSWTVDQFTASYAGTCVTSTQFLRNVTVDCETGQVTATTDTTLDGQPYTPAGQVGQCLPVGGTEQCTDCETITLCDTGSASPGESPGEPVPFLRHICRGCDGQVTSVEDTTLDGAPYTPGGEVGLCGPEAGQPCRNTSSLLVCDIPVDGVEGAPVAADADPTPYPFDDSPVRCVNPLPGGAPPLWGGGSVVVPVTTGGCSPAQTLVGAAATLQAPRPSCDDGTAQVAVSLRLTNDGPNPTAGNYAGGLRLHRTDTGQRLGDHSIIGVVAVGESRTLTVTATVPAALLPAGQLVAVFDVESSEAVGNNNPGSEWTVDQFTADYTYGIDSCVTQVFANVVTDCETGQVESITYTTPDGAPYTPVGEVGQCMPATPAPEPCRDCETITLCDAGEPSPDASPGEVEPVPFLRHICRDCDGQVTSVEDTTLDGQPYTPVGEVGICGPEAGQPCQVASTFQRCMCDDLSDTSPGEIVTYSEVWAVDCRGEVSLIHTYRDDPASAYTPTNPVDCSQLATDGEQVVGVQAHRVQLNPGDTWDALADGGPLLQAVTVTNVSTTPATITTADGTSTLFPSETVTFSVQKPSDLTLGGPLTVTADPGATVTVHWTTAVTA